MNEDYLTREDDYDTSEAAAATIAKTLSKRKQLILSVFRDFPDGLTDEELTEEIVRRGHPRGSESGYRKRRTDLLHDGYVHDTGLRRKNSRGQSVIVWALKKAAE